MEPADANDDNINHGRNGKRQRGYHSSNSYGCSIQLKHSGIFLWLAKKSKVRFPSPVFLFRYRQLPSRANGALTHYGTSP
jgi:hypothetical protein